ncbi:hypothetical protein INT43_005929 [Umbelopsis isabellina]|uniref:C2H2-type domain-containing protein n=1 Tax=Mortierella isabellina TaxID=91625 RepID=A0A8H7PJ02_MORIS|nr:hypothetical protein INT43_005929 [Umbelopsis isabellina]
MDLLSGTDASGRHISLLNFKQSTNSSVEEDSPSPSLGRSASPYSSDNEMKPRGPLPQQQVNSKRKYHCREPGCDKSFTTSGHLARHNRIHTGEKNFPCLFPGCQSRFSRQDNMMQHYRTHMSPKSRRTHKSKYSPSEDHPVPHLHAHHRFRSDSHRMQPPLTIDQHLSQHQNTAPSHPLRLEDVSHTPRHLPPNVVPAATQPSNSTSTRRYGFHPYPPPSSLSSSSGSSFPVPVAIRQITSNGINSPHNTPGLTALSSTTLPPISQIMELPPPDSGNHGRSRSNSHHRLPTPPSLLDRSRPPPPAAPSHTNLSTSSTSPTPYYHRSSYVESGGATTLLGSTLMTPSRSAGQTQESHQQQQPGYHTMPSPQERPQQPHHHHHHQNQDNSMNCDDEDADDDSQSIQKRTEMLKLTHIVSTFG